MAIDTVTKRFSILGLFNPALKHVIPSGTITAGQRSTFLDLYSGIALTEPVSVFSISARFNIKFPPDDRTIEFAHEDRDIIIPPNSRGFKI
ncbi:MAG: hypothetical protein JKY53_00245 [Flavobacteriales bacterium]|nr:hypothetical protein [Flavobacteriales bacterium]